MYKKNISILLVSLVALFLGVTEVSGWGEVGHAIIADIGQALLTAPATQALQKYIPGKKMDQVSSVPDDYDHTPEGRWSEPLHFVNMQRGQTQFNFQEDCSKAPGCVVSAIQNYTAVLKSQYSSGKYFDSEPNALVFIIHFVGDSHQPLHIGYTDDLGGNTVKCSFFGVQTELHAVWDTYMIQRYNKDHNSFAQELLQTIKSNSTMLPYYSRIMNPVDWANESFDLVRNNVYVGVSGNNPNLSDSYYNANLPIVKLRLMAAGIRLATLLNAIFK